MIICNGSAGPINVSYPVGAGSFTLLNGVPGISINAETGAISIDWGVLSIGIFDLFIQYTLGGSNFVYQLTLTIVDCTPRPVLTVYNVCNKSTNQTYQILFNNGLTYNDVTLQTPTTGISVSSSGLITIAPTFTTAANITIRYNGSTQATITINPVNCLIPDETDIVECEKDSIGISWINQEGGRQSFYFNQPKEFGIAQSGGEEYKNADKEKRYYTRGEVEETVNINQQFIPIEFVTSINSLKNSIQAWAFTDINTNSTYKSIIIDEDTWIFKRTTDRYYTLSFSFRYSKSKVIQKQ